jgi:YNFM family putative membrane transporter
MAPRSLRPLLASLFLFVFGFAFYDELFPIYARSLGASAVELGTLFTLAQVMLTVGVLLGGFLSDRYGSRTLMVISWIAVVPVPLMYLAAPTWAWLIPGVILFNITYSGLPALNAYVSANAQREQIASAFGTIGAASSAGSFLGRGLGGIVAERFGMSTNFLVALICFAASTAAMFLTAPDRSSRRPAVRITEAVPLRTLAGRRPSLGLLAVVNAVPLALLPFVSPFLREVRGLGLSEIGVLGSMLSLGALIAAYIFGRLADRLGRARVLIVILLTCALGNLLVVLGPPALLPLAFVLRTARGLGVVSEALVGSMVGAGESGRAFGAWYTIIGIVAAIGTFLAGFAYKADAALPLLLGPAILLAAAGALAWRQGTRGEPRLLREEISP